MSERTDDYIARRAEFDASTKRSDDLARQVASVAALVSNWRRVMFANANVAFPADLVFGSASSVDVKAWPDIQRIAEAAAAWHTAKHEMINAWHRLTDSERAALQPPPE